MAGRHDPGSLEAALVRADRGDLEGLDRIVELGRRGQALPEGWREAIQAARWKAGTADALPSVDALRARVSAPPSVRRAAARACAVVVGQRILSFDRAGADAAIELHAELTVGDDADQQRQLQLERAWMSIAQGADVPAVEALSALGKGAAAAKAAAPLVESTALRALALAELGDIEQAVTVARRACRMARTESLPGPEYLSGIVLARVRRLSGRPYLATRILAGLRRFAPSVWSTWIDWEAVMAGGSAESTCDTPAAGLAAALQRETMGAFAQAMDSVAERVRRWAPLSRDIHALHAAIDRTAPVSAGSALAKWRSGELDELPRGLVALAAGGRDAYVAVDPDAAPVRVLAREVTLGSGVCLEPSSGRAGRAQGLLAVVALAGANGIGIDAAFKTVYGFSYSPSAHADTLSVTVHRARKRLAEHGDLARSAHDFRLTARRPILVADPRCAPRLQGAVLHRMAEQEGISARDLAAALGVPLRTIQHCVRDLLDVGACAAARSGREILYRVEDTTFQEPTRVRRRS